MRVATAVGGAVGSEVRLGIGAVGVAVPRVVAGEDDPGVGVGSAIVEGDGEKVLGRGETSGAGLPPTGAAGVGVALNAGGEPEPAIPPSAGAA